MTRNGTERRGVHGLISVSMLVGFVITTGGVLLAVLSDYGEDLSGSAECMLSDVALYDTGYNRTYFVVMLHNLGSEDATSANVTFVDDYGVEHGFYDTTADIASGSAWEGSGSFAASVSDKAYMVRASMATADGSRAECIAGRWG